MFDNFSQMMFCMHKKSRMNKRGEKELNEKKKSSGLQSFLTSPRYFFFRRSNKNASQKKFIQELHFFSLSLNFVLCLFALRKYKIRRVMEQCRSEGEMWNDD